MADSDVLVNANDLANLQAIAGLASKVYDHPKTGPVMQRLIKEVAPQAHIPALDVQQIVDERVAVLDKKIADFDARTEAQRRKEMRDAAVAEIQADPHLKIADDEIAAVEDILKNEGGSYNGAAHAFRRRQEIAAPRNTRIDDSRMYLPGQKMFGGATAGGDEHKGLWEDPVGWSHASILDTMERFRNGTLDPKWTA